MRIKVTAELQPELLDLLRSLDLEFKYAYTIQDDDNIPQSFYILIYCSAISRLDLESLLPWGSFIVCPHNNLTLALFTSLPEDIKKCII